MLRQLRLEYRGAIYHLMNRGDRPKSIFKDDRDEPRINVEDPVPLGRPKIAQRFIAGGGVANPLKVPQGRKKSPLGLGTGSPKFCRPCGTGSALLPPPQR